MDNKVLYLDTLCVDPFWNGTLTLQSTWPRFTHCFLHSALSWPAPLFFLFLFPLKLTALACGSHVQQRSQFRLSFLFVLRGLGISSLSVLSLLLLIKNIIDNDNFQSSYVVLLSNCLRFFTYICVALLLIYERHKAEVASGPSFLFWAVLTVTETLTLYERTMLKFYETDLSDFIITTIMYVLIVYECVLCFVPDVKKLEKSDKDKEPWPEQRASFPSLISYTWMSKTVVTAWRRTLTENDIYELPDHSKGENLMPDFDRVWNKCVIPSGELRKYSSNGDISHDYDRLHKKTSRSSTQHSSPRSSPNGIQETKTSVNGESSGASANENPAAGASVKENGDASEEAKSKKEENDKLPFTLMTTLFKIHGARYSVGILMKILADCLNVLQPLIIREIIKTVQFRGGLRPLWVGVMLSIALLGTGMGRSILNNFSLYQTTKIGLQVKSALMSAIFRKSLRMSSEARKRYTAGEIITLMSVDAQRVQEVWRVMVMLAGSPVQLIASAVLLYYTIGVASVAGLVTLLLLLPINSILATKMRKYQALNMSLKDKRVKLTTDVLNGIRVLKLYSWEKSFEEKISKIRNEEMKNLQMLAYLRTAMAANNWMTPYLVTLATFATYVLISDENHLDPATAFVSLTYFSIMRAPLVIITYIIAGIIMATVSLKRINKFLYGEDLDEDCVGSSPRPGSAVSVERATFAWEAEADPVLSDISLHVPKRSLTMIVGKVGSGKSSLLSAILGEMRLFSGTVDLEGSVAYVAQQAWIQNASVRDNILFGSTYDPGRYKTVVEACALGRDLSILPLGDQTEIGEKGINLSGGQKQRVALARAVYSNQDLYILDDPLSAVDAHVGKHIFDRVVGPQGLLKYKTRVLVTHGAHWLPYADQVVMLHQGTVGHVGTYQQLLSLESDFIQMLKQPDKEEENEEEVDGLEELLEGDQYQEILDTPSEKQDESTNFGAEQDKSVILMKRLSSIESVGKSIDKKQDAEPTVKQKDDGKIIEEERMEEGKVKLGVLLSWFKAAGLIGIFIYFMLLTLFQASSSAASYWIRFWTEDSYLANTTLAHTEKYSDTNDYYLGIYGAFGGVQILFLAFGDVFYWRSAVKAARHMHSGMLASILRSPTSFFDTTPVGRMLNRFSLDTDVVDNAFPLIYVDLLKCLNQILSTIIVVCLNVPLFATVIVPIFFMFYIFLAFYLPTARQLKRMDTVARSPIYSHFGEAVGGASTIRAFGHTHRFSHDSGSKVDHSIIRTLTLLSCSSWLAFLVDSLGMLLMFSAAIFAVVSTDVEGAAAGLAISYTVEFSMFLGYLVRQWTEMTANSVSIERILEYTELKPEGLHTEYQCPASWPDQGQVVFKDFKIRYREGLDLVLKGITATINPGEKVGIVGRTGAGKSTMTLALFRLIEAAGGAICVDGTNIADLPLSTLRSKLSILPQDPVLFSGTLRMNVDPHDEYSDEQVTKALDRAHLSEVVKSVSGGLSFDVGEEGKNLSVGQRQLVCLARALLRQNKILVLDEATAAVDVQTDSFIQETIRTAFKDCTVLTIAHRINTIMDYDRVMVLENGELKEFASVQELLTNSNSLFYSLAKEAKLV